MAAKPWWEQDRSHKTEWGKIKPDKRSKVPKYWAGEPIGRNENGDMQYRGCPDGTFTSRKKAQDWLNKRRYERDGERAMADAAKIDATFGHWLEIWINNHKLAYVENRIAENGWDAYEGNYRNWLTRVEVDGKLLTEYKMSKIDPAFCKKIQIAVRKMKSLKTGKLSPASSHKAEMNIYSVMKLAADQNAIPSNPFRDKSVKVSNHDPAREIGELNEGDIEELIENTPDEYKAAIFLWAYTGLRAGEVWGLQVRDLYLDNERVAINRQLCVAKDKLIRDKNHVYESGQAHPVGVCLDCQRNEDGELPREIEFGTRIRKGVVLRPPKTGREKTLDLHPFVIDALRKHLEIRKPERPDDWLFVDQHARRAGRGLPVNHINWYGYHFKPVVAMLEWEDETDVHTLRHFCGAYHLMLGYPPFAVQRMLDHSSEGMTRRYSHLIKGAAAIYHGRAQAAYDARKAAQDGNGMGTTAA
jgi:integrase